MDWTFVILMTPILERQVTAIKARSAPALSRRDRGLLRYGLELDRLSSDLQIIPTELRMAIRNYYVQPERWPLKKFHLTYQPEHFAFRIHAFREKVFGFVNLALELGISDGPGLIGRVVDELKRR